MWYGAVKESLVDLGSRKSPGALWKRYQRQPHYSWHTFKTKVTSGLKENEGRFSYLSKVILRNLDPQMYLRYVADLAKSSNELRHAEKEHDVEA